PPCGQHSATDEKRAIHALLPEPPAFEVRPLVRPYAHPVQPSDGDNERDRAMDRATSEIPNSAPGAACRYRTERTPFRDGRDRTGWSPAHRADSPGSRGSPLGQLRGLVRLSAIRRYQGTSVSHTNRGPER